MAEETQFKLSDFRETGIEPFDWAKYNTSQTKEKILFFKLLDEILQTIENEKIANKIFCMCLKVYSNTSSRRLISDLELCKRSRMIDHVPHFNSVLNYFNDSSMKSYLNYLLELSALPLAQIERKFAVDATGISLHKYQETWKAIRGKFEVHRQYMKAHIIYGVLSNIAVSCRVTSGNAADSPQFETLLKRTADNFNIEEVSADLAYSSKRNLQAVSNLGGIPYIPFKENAVGKGVGVWNQMYKYFKTNQVEFLKHYHLRSNAESGFFMIKSKFGEFVRCKNETAQANEILVKVLCHNLCVLIQELFLQGIEIDFSKSARLFVAQRKL